MKHCTKYSKVHNHLDIGGVITHLIDNTMEVFERLSNLLWSWYVSRIYRFSQNPVPDSKVPSSVIIELMVPVAVSWNSYSCWHVSCHSSSGLEMPLRLAQTDSSPVLNTLPNVLLLCKLWRVGGYMTQEDMILSMVSWRSVLKHNKAESLPRGLHSVLSPEKMWSSLSWVAHWVPLGIPSGKDQSGILWKTQGTSPSPALWWLHHVSHSRDRQLPFIFTDTLLSERTERCKPRSSLFTWSHP